MSYYSFCFTIVFMLCFWYMIFMDFVIILFHLDRRSWWFIVWFIWDIDCSRFWWMSFILILIVFLIHIRYQSFFILLVCIMGILLYHLLPRLVILLLSRISLLLLFYSVSLKCVSKYCMSMLIVSYLFKKW